MKKLYATLAAAMIAAPALFAQAPETLYLVGNFNEWNTPDAGNAIELTSSDNNGVYSVFLTYEGSTTLQFKFFDAPTNNWTENSYGAEQAMDVTLTANQPSTWAFVPDGADFKITNWAGVGTVTIDWNNQTLSVVSSAVADIQPEEPGGTPEVIYIIGEPQGWDINSTAMPLELSGDDVYTGTYDIADGKFMLRFYSALGNWEANSIGSQVADNPIEVSFINGVFASDCVYGKGSWSIPEWTGGLVNFEVDLLNMTVTFTDVATGVQLNVMDKADNFKVYNMQGINVLNTSDAAGLNNLKGMYIINGKKVILK